MLRISGGEICGDGHSLFQVEGSRSGLLELTGVKLRHVPSPSRTEQRSQGAAIFVRGKGQLALHDCNVRSTSGFSLWLVQKASAAVNGCDFPGGERSTAVAFEDASLVVTDSRFSDATPHALCARGTASVVVRGCVIEGAALRAIYCYHSAKLEVTDCHIAGTCSKETAAVQVDALRPGDSATISLARTTFTRNLGGDLSTTGNVQRSITCACNERTEASGQQHAPFALRERDPGFTSPDARRREASRSPYDLWRPPGDDS